DGFGSLRAAIAAANAQPGADVIHFTRQVRGTIVLSSGPLDITDDVEIRGPGAWRLAVSGSHLSRIFNISGGAPVTIAGLTITEGMAVGAPGDGGGILNTGGTLSLARVVLSNNQAVGTPGAAGRGGAIANVSGAILTATHCRFTQNQALGGNGGGQGGSGAIFNMAHRGTGRHNKVIAQQTNRRDRGGPPPGRRPQKIKRVENPTPPTPISFSPDTRAMAGEGRVNTVLGGGGGFKNKAVTATVENSTFLGNLARGGSNNIRTGALVGPAGGAGIFNADGAILFLSG